MFVDEAFVNDYLRAPVPYVSGVVYERLATGRSPVLSMKDAAAANESSALNLLILHFVTKYPNPIDERGRAILAAAHSGFQLTHLGYRARRILQEAYGDAQVPFFTAGGFLCKSDYAEFYQRHPPTPPPDRRPYLMGLFDDDPWDD